MLKAFLIHSVSQHADYNINTTLTIAAVKSLMVQAPILKDRLERDRQTDTESQSNKKLYRQANRRTDWWINSDVDKKKDRRTQTDTD